MEPSQAERIVFFNHYHNGDLFLSRPFVQYLMRSRPGPQYWYTHQCAADLLADIPNLNYDAQCIKQLPQAPRWAMDEKTRTLFINTWVGMCNSYYADQYARTFCIQIARHVMSLTLQEIFGLEPLPLAECKVHVDFARFFIGAVDAFIREDTRRKVLICNGLALSGQSINFDFVPIIDALARHHPDVLFIPTSATPLRLANVIHSADIIKKGGPDLNENSYLGTFCDIIVGRSSGPYSLSLQSANLGLAKTFIGFVHRPTECSLGFHDPAFERRCAFVASNNFEPNAVAQVISEHITKLGTA